METTENNKTTPKDRSKTFKMTEQTLEKVNEVIQTSGLGASEFFEEMLSHTIISRIAGKEGNHSSSMQKQFEVDVERLKTATSSIVSLFISQMENMTVEKNRWDDTMEKRMTEMKQQVSQEKEKRQKTEEVCQELKNEIQQLKDEKEELSKKAKEHEERIADKDVLISRLEKENERIQEEKKDQREEINRLNQKIIEKDEKIQTVTQLEQDLAEEKRKVATTKAEAEQQVQQAKIDAETDYYEKLDTVREKERDMMEGLLDKQIKKLEDTMNARLTDKQNEIDNMKTQKDDLEKQIGAERVAKEKLEEELKQTKHTLEILRTKGREPQV